MVRINEITSIPIIKQLTSCQHNKLNSSEEKHKEKHHRDNNLLPANTMNEIAACIYVCMYIGKDINTKGTATHKLCISINKIKVSMNARTSTPQTWNLLAVKMKKKYQ